MITAPFNFVPLNNTVFFPDWADKISHDIPFEDGESGVIELKITTHSPIFIRNGYDKKNNTDNNYLSFSKIGNQYFIPATSIKGIIRNVLEIFSFGKLSQYNNDYFAYRDFNLPQYRENMSNIQCGWLQKKADNKFYLSKRGEPEKVTHQEIRAQFRNFNANGDDVFLKQESLGTIDLYPNFRNGKLVCTGKMHGKFREYIFPHTPIDNVAIKDEVIQSFLTVYKSNPIFETKWIPKINSGESIPVFFTEKNNNDVHSIGLSYMYRYPFGKSIEQCISQEITNNKKDLSDVIFGYINEDASLKGRVQFCHAFTISKVNPEEIRGILGKPRASYYPLYLKQDQAPYHDYDNEESEIAGRKRYRIHGKLNNNKSTKELPQGNQNENVMNIFKPLPEGTEFITKIKVHNLKPVELGALFSTILLHKTTNVYHNIGLAKSFGYGKISFEISRISNFEFKIEDYLKVFEKEMSVFTFKNYNKIWSKTEQIKTFMQIASDHLGNDILMMNLDEYKQHKKFDNFSILNETAQPTINSLVAENEVISEIIQTSMKTVKSLIEATKINFGECGTHTYTAIYVGNKKAILDQTDIEIQCIIPKEMREPIIGSDIHVVIQQYSKSGFITQVKLTKES